MTYRFKLIIVLIFIIFTAEKCIDEYHYITSEGIERFVEDSAMVYIDQFEAFVGDTFINDIFIYTDDLTDYVGYDGKESGMFFYPNEIIINTIPSRFVAYRLADLSQYQRDRYLTVNMFVKATMLHEITHAFFIETIHIMQFERKHVEYSYRNFRIISIREDDLGARFIEEGVCEYMVQKMNESAPPIEVYRPTWKSDITAKENNYKVFYEYSAYYLKEFLDNHTLREGIEILVRNKPPTQEEILKPELFFQRLM